jgi:transposase-like protein
VQNTNESNKQEPMDKSTKISREKLSWLFEQPLDIKVSMLTQHLSICQMIINQILEEEVNSLAGSRYSHDKPNSGLYSRYGFNPGSVRIGDKRLSVEIPRVINNDDGKFTPLQSYSELRKIDEPTDELVNGVLYGLSTRDYRSVMDHLSEGFGLSKSSVSSRFIDATSDILKEYESRTLEHLDLVAVFMDGKHLANQQIIIALGVTFQGDKVPLGFVQTTTENSVAIGAFLKDLIDRGLRYDEGLLFVIDGSKGMRKAIKDVFEDKALIQRCCWHKRENILSYLPEQMHSQIKSKYHKALEMEKYNEARSALIDLANELNVINKSAARSLEEALDELLTLHKLGINDQFASSFQTTNCIENVNSQLRKYIGRVKYWKNSDQRYRWIAAALTEIEGKSRKVDNFKNLKNMRTAISKYLQDKQLNPL